MSQAVLDELQRRFFQHIIETSSDDAEVVICIQRIGLLPLIKYLWSDLEFHILVDICGCDYPQREQRLEVVYQFKMGDDVQRTELRGLRVRIRVPLFEQDAVVPSLMFLFRNANWLEREVWDMYGIRFDGHPDLRRLLTHWKFEGHPLRKRYPKQKRQYLDEPAPVSFFNVRPRQREDGAMTEVVDIGPMHPITQGRLRLLLEFNGEHVVGGDVEIGYLHRGFEKEAEDLFWGGVIPYCERLNYHSAPVNAIGYAMACEQLAGIEVPERAVWMRMFFSELARVMDHALCLGNALHQMGALTHFWFFFQVRELCTQLFEQFSGHRVTGAMVRIGGYVADVPSDFEEKARGLIATLRPKLYELERLLANNRIFLDRTVGVGRLPKEAAIAYGMSGPIARASGIAFDLRKDRPYAFYDQIDFELVVASNGDVYDRMMVRFYEIKESLNILEQTIGYIATTHGQPVLADVYGVTPPDIHETYTQIDAMMRHFQLATKGEQLPKGEGYTCIESPNGELGFYLVSDGSSKPQRLHVRSPSLCALQGLIPMSVGGTLAEVGVLLGSLNIVPGELDR